MEQYLRVGVISSTHGVRGEVKVYPTTDDPARFKKLKKVILDMGREQRELAIESVKFFKNMVILKFKGIDNINDIEKYKGCDLLVSRENAVPLEEGEFYLADIMGMPVIDEEERELGVIREVLQTGANDVYIIQKKRGGEILLPAIPSCILDIDFENNRMKVHLMPGLEEL